MLTFTNFHFSLQLFEMLKMSSEIGSERETSENLPGEEGKEENVEEEEEEFGEIKREKKEEENNEFEQSNENSKVSHLAINFFENF